VFIIERRILKSILLSEEVTSFLRNQILNPQLFPEGSYIREEKLAQELNISRGPVREALKVLDSEGLVKIIPRKGAVVVDFSSEEVEELWELRFLMEKTIFKKIIEQKIFTDQDFKLLAGLLAEVQKIIDEGEYDKKLGDINEINYEFHSYLAKISQKKHTTEILIDVYKKLRQAMMRVTPSRIEDFVEKHMELLVNLREGKFSCLVENIFYSYFERRHYSENSLILPKK